MEGTEERETSQDMYRRDVKDYDKGKTPGTIRGNRRPELVQQSPSNRDPKEIPQGARGDRSQSRRDGKLHKIQQLRGS